jgi:hypothetical protein
MEIPTMPKRAKSSQLAPSGPRTRRTRTPAAAEPTAGAAGGAASVCVRFYCQGIGDCHLLRFRKNDGSNFWMLIDCGIHSSVTSGTNRINAIVDDIASVTKKLDVIVLTHEHWDHNSGFLSAQAKFKDFDVGEVWMGWTENPADPQAREFDKFKGEAIKALHGVSQKLDGNQGLSPHLSNVQRGLQAILGFNFGAKGEKVRAARNAAISLARKGPKYLEPKTAPFELPDVPNMRVYVLGPPRDTAMFGITERPSEMYGIGGTAGWPMASALNNSFAMGDGTIQSGQDTTAPFDPNEGFLLSDLATPPATSQAGGDPAAAPSAEDTERARTAAFVRDFYTGAPASEVATAPGTRPPPAYDTEGAWRRIDGDWLGIGADLGIQLDKRTNNSSLVLAFEFTDTKRVLLFVGDAQVGNWLSWKDVQWKVGDATVKAHDLLARTVFYKVGHHGSHNATLKAMGLELMVNPDLSAFIPTNKEDAKNVGWGEMPFEPLLEDLEKRASNRVIRADDPWLAQSAGTPNFNTFGAIKGLRHDTTKGLWVELDIG